MSQVPSEVWKSIILDMETKLCNKFLAMDERNFHCWNYRLWVVENYIKEIRKRVPDKESAHKIEIELIRGECSMAKGIIEKNFSNYSAWHYRGKLMPRIYEVAKTADNFYALPLNVIREDLESLKHAYFTDPKD